MTGVGTIWIVAWKLADLHLETPPKPVGWGRDSYFMPACRYCAAPFEDGLDSCPACGNPADPPVGVQDPLIGKTLSGGYRIEGVIGAGAMAKVYAAEQTNLRRTVAVKVLHAHLMFDEATGRRFINEARTASRLNHPHSLAVFDFGQMENKQPYMVMEYLRGPDLERVVREEGPLSFHRIIDILLQLLDALSEAHELDIIHRDLKPENIVIEPVRSGGDFVKVVDFGLAKIMNAVEDISITATGTVCGTPDFMSPEQCRGDKLDARSDLYAVGVNLFVLLTGRVPFLAATPTQALLLHLTAPPPDPRSVAPDRLIPESLARVTLKAMAKEPSERFQTADEFAATLAKIRGELGSDSTSLQPGHTMVRCPACGGFAPPGTKFCVECGAPVSTAVRGPDSRRSAIAPQISSQLSLVGRDTALVALLDPLQQRVRSLRSVLVRGEEGIGKTRLVQEFASRAQRRGHRMVLVDPDPWTVGVAYCAARRAIAALAKLPDDGGSPPDWIDASPSAQLGLAEVFGRNEAEAGNRNVRAAVRDALAWSIGRADKAAQDGMTVLVFDDLHIIDGTSRRAIADLLKLDLDTSTFVIGTVTPDFDPGWPVSTQRLQIHRLSPEEAMLVLEQSGMRDRMLELPSAPVAPLFLEQMVRYAADATGKPPSRLGDLIDRRLTGLDAAERQVVQAVAVLGSDTTADDIRRLLGHDDGLENACTSLVEAGLLKRQNGSFRFRHGLIRQVALNAIPAGVFRELCRRALEVMRGKQLPVEALAWYTVGAEDAFEALILLDQLGTAALARDDADAAVDAYRRALEFARIELVRGNLDDPMHAVVVFGRKFGEALTAAGRPGDAEGVLREALDFAEQGSSDQARVMLAIARASYSRERVSNAVRWAQRAAQVAKMCRDNALRDDIEGLIRRWGG